jgi:hypothetical protein
MKKIMILCAMFMLIASVAFSAPFVICDPPIEAITLYKLTGPAWVPVSVPAVLDGSIHLDAAASTVGENALTISACMSDPLWGESCSDPVPFAFVRPSLAKPSGPKNGRLAPL